MDVARHAQLFSSERGPLGAHDEWVTAFERPGATLADLTTPSKALAEAELTMSSLEWQNNFLR
ncbi:hypothetical protein [Streptomyces sp. NPDC003077]|uniref:hypothetical protein n=1 Tax=Streptomyces sp. NPDC003077 TaxID=3154443 RepID=UPI0033BB335A